MPSGSLDDVPSKCTTSGRAPDCGVALAAAVGGVFGVTVMVTVSVSVAPLSSVTVSVATFVPGRGVACGSASAVSAEPPSPKSQWRVTIVPSESVESRRREGHAAGSLAR